MRKILVIGTILMRLAAGPLPAHAQAVRDTLTLTLPQVEAQFLQTNFALLAQKYAIEGARAGVVQAALFPNPVIQVEQQITNRQIPETEGRLFPLRNGEQDVQIQQLVLLAGKRSKQINLARLNAEQTEYQFYDLIRTLSLDLRSSFFDIYFSQQALRMFDEEIPTIRRLVTAFQEQADKGNVAFKEVIRLQSFLLDLENGRTDLLRQLADEQATLKVLIGDTSDRYLRTQPDRAQLETLDPNALTLNQLASIAQENRYDLRAAETNTRLGMANLALQKALAVPDVALGLNYDKLAGYGTNYLGLTAQFAVPVFNRNQGNIRAAQAQSEAAKLLLSQSQTTVQNELLRSLVRARESDRLYRAFDQRFIQNFDRLIDGVVTSYQRRNISLLEFTDFLESYRTSVIQLNGLQADRMRAFEELNFAAGKKLFAY